MLETYSHEQLHDLVGHEVHDREGKKVGYVDLVFIDTDTGAAEWMGIWNGLPRGKRHLVPLQGIRRDRDEIVLPWIKELVESAPTYDEEDDRTIFDGERHFGISQEKENEAFRHYGLERPDGPRLRVWVYAERAETVVRR